MSPPAAVPEPRSAAVPEPTSAAIIEPLSSAHLRASPRPRANRRRVTSGEFAQFFEAVDTRYEDIIRRLDDL